MATLKSLLSAMIDEINEAPRSVNGVTPDENGDIKIEVGTGTGSDWNQNDETAKDYVKNRPFYSELVDGMEYSWDGVIKENIPTYNIIYNIFNEDREFSLIKVSNFISIENDSRTINGIMSSNNSLSTDFEVPLSNFEQKNGYSYYMDFFPTSGEMIFSLIFIVTTQEGAKSLGLPDVGTYVNYVNYNDSTKVNYYFEQINIPSGEHLVKIDTKYLPKLEDEMLSQGLMNITTIPSEKYPLNSLEEFVNLPNGYYNLTLPINIQACIDEDENYNPIYRPFFINGLIYKNDIFITSYACGSSFVFIEVIDGELYSGGVSTLDGFGYAEAERILGLEGEWLETEAQTVIGAINEINTNKADAFYVDSEIQKLIGDTPVATQINTAVSEHAENKGNPHEVKWEQLPDKPFGEVLLTWDGNTEGLDTTSVNGMNLYKISDLTPPSESFIGGEVALQMSDGSTEIFDITEDFILEGNGGYAVGELFVCVATSTTITAFGIELTVPSTGMYFINGEMGENISAYTLYAKFINKIDEKYLPNTSSVEWEQIENKPFYEGISNTLEWDGTDGDIIVDLGEGAALHHVCDSTPTISELIGATVHVLYDGGIQTVNLTEDNTVDMGDFYMVADCIGIALKDNVQVNVEQFNLNLPKKGIYFGKYGGMYPTKIVATTEIFNIVKKIESKFLPEIPLENLPEQLQFGEVIDKVDTLILDKASVKTIVRVPEEAIPDVTVNYYHVSSAVPEIEDLVGGRLTISGGSGNTFVLSEDSFESDENMYIYGLDNIPWILVVKNDNTTIEVYGTNITFPKKGIYFFEGNQDTFTMSVGTVVAPSKVFEVESIKPIDYKYLPESLQFGDMTKVILPENIYTVISSYGMNALYITSPANSDIMAGETYTVIWNDDTYEITATLWDSGSYVLEGTDDAPFERLAFGTTPLGVDGGVPIYGLVLVRNSNVTESVKLSIVQKKLETIDPIFLPYTYGTEDLEAGLSTLETGKLYFVYE